MKKLLLAAMAALFCQFCQLASAVEVAGVRFADQTGFNGELLVNGAGLRKKVFFQIYAMALYLPEKSGDSEAVLAGKGGKRIAITLLRDLTAQQFVEALQEGMANNHSEAEMAGLKDRLKQFSDLMLAIGEAKTGTSILIDWLPASGTRLTGR